jgi:hypothetical protein
MAETACFNKVSASLRSLVAGDADTCGKLQTVVVDAEGAAQRQEDFLSAQGRIPGMRHLGGARSRIITAEAADGVRAAHAIAQSLRGGSQQAVGDVVAQGVVDVLEAIDVQEQHCHLLPVTVSQGHCPVPGPRGSPSPIGPVARVEQCIPNGLGIRGVFLHQEYVVRHQQLAAIKL